MAAVGDEFAASFDDLSVDVLADILGFLLIKDTMRSRRINKKTREAVKKTIVPPTDFRVESVEEYNAMNLMTTEMPNLQQITICDIGYGYYRGGHKWSDGEDPDEEEAARTAHRTAHDIEIIANFRKLRVLKIDGYDAGGVQLNGRYPFLFNSFPLLQKLSINEYDYLKWDLGMLGGFPLLKEFHSDSNYGLTGNISNLRVLKGTLEKVNIDRCPRVEGNFMDLADFPRLKEVKLGETAVTGDIRDIGSDDFSSLEQLYLPKGVYGGRGSKLQRISDGPDLVRTVYLLKKQRPAVKMEDWHWLLSAESPDWYDGSMYSHPPPFYIRFVQAGPRIGYRWTSHLRPEHGMNRSCEVNWLDPEPDRETTGSYYYGFYMQELRKVLSQENFYRGFHQPPTEEEYHSRLGLEEHSDSDSVSTLQLVHEDDDSESGMESSESDE